MKKLNKSLLSLALVGCVLPLAACSVDAEPKNIKDKFVTFDDTDKSYFRDTYEYLWDNYTNGGSTSSTVLTEVVNIIAQKELVSFYGSQEKLDAEILKLCKKKLMDKVLSGSYDVDKIFQEEKLVKELRASLYDVKLPEGKNYNNSLLLTPEMDVSVDDDKFEETYNKIFSCDYSDYFEKSYKSDIYKQLLTAQYITENEFTTLARTYARRVSWIKLENIDKKPMAASNLINDWLGSFVTKASKSELVDSKFDLNSLSRIWKAIPEGTVEEAYVTAHYTLQDQIDDEIAKICDPATFEMLDDLDIEKSIEDKYTNNGAYTLEWGYTLAQRELAKKSFSGADLYTKSTGISDLPSDITDRIFSTSLGTSSGYLKEVTYKYGADDASAVEDKVYFLTPKNSEAVSDSMSKYYHYIDGAYYIVLVDNDTFTTESLKSGCKVDADGNITEYSRDVYSLAETLGETSSNQREAVIHYLEKYDVSSHVHDDTFYEYLEDNYSELFD